MAARAVSPAPGFGHLLWWLPRLAFLAFVAALVVLFWFVQRTEQEEQRATLISDMLWLEQGLRFILNHNVELLGRFDPLRIDQASVFDAHAKTLLGSNTGLIQIAWVDPAGHVKQALPPTFDDQASGTGQALADEQQQLARSLGHAVHGAAYPALNDDWRFEVHVPIYQGGELSGLAIGIYSIRRLLDDTVPWWLAERYRIAIVDQSGGMLGQRSNVGDVDSGNDYQMPFDPPGHGLMLHAVPYRVPAALAGKLITTGLFLLAMLVLFSLWTLRRHVQRRLEAESALQTEVAFRKAMEDSVQTGLRARNLQGCITYVNPAFCHMVGWSAEELIGCVPPMPYWAEEYLDETRNLHAMVLAGEAPSEGFEIKLKRRDGEIFDALIIEAPLIDNHGQHTGWMGSVVDITERKRAEERARQQDEHLQASARLISMGEMASTLAHELSQPLSAISSYATGCRNLIASRAPPDEIDGAIAKCQEQAQRAGRVIRRIYDFIQRHEPQTEPCALESLLADVLTLVDADARRQRIRIVRDFESALPMIPADRILLGQAILNLTRNGIESMRFTEDRLRILTIRARRLDRHVAIAVADHGTGISAEASLQLFEPFYTTKSEGLGIGLNICRSVVEAHQGRLWFDPNPEGGSIFNIILPIDPAARDPYE